MDGDALGQLLLNNLTGVVADPLQGVQSLNGNGGPATPPPSYVAGQIYSVLTGNPMDPGQLPPNLLQDVQNGAPLGQDILDVRNAPANPLGQPAAMAQCT